MLQYLYARAFIQAPLIQGPLRELSRNITWGIQSPAPAMRDDHRVPNSKMTRAPATQKWPPAAPLFLTHPCKPFSSLHEILCLPRAKIPSKPLRLSHKTRFWPSNSAESLKHAAQNIHSSKDRHGTKARRHLHQRALREYVSLKRRARNFAVTVT